MWKLLHLLDRRSTPSPGAGGRNDELRASGDLERDINFFQEALHHSSDLNIRRFRAGVPPFPDAALLSLQGLVDNQLEAEAVLKPLMQPREIPEAVKDRGVPEIAETTLIASDTFERSSFLRALLAGLLSGHCVVLFEGATEGLIIGVRGWEHRSVDEPPSESMARGPREGFVETLQTNTALLRRRIRNDGLTFKRILIGRRSQTPVVVAYIRDIADPGIVTELVRRLEAVDIDGVLDSGQLSEFITDAPRSPVTTVGSTERPDVIASRLLEGRAAVLVDGSPFVLTVPSLLIEGFQSPQDYYLNPYFQSMMRLTRYVAFAFSVLSLPFYVAVTTYAQELIPTPLLLSIAASKEGTPFPVAVEGTIMLLFFEILREASLRMPRALGEVVAIVGALVIGQSAVSAGIVGAPVVIVTALTAISSFVVPAHTDVGAVVRLFLLILGSTLGLYGLVMGSMVALGHVASLNSFGVPVLSPFAPVAVSDMKDAVVRFPWGSMGKRPTSLEPRDDPRQVSTSGVREQPRGGR